MHRVWVQYIPLTHLHNPSHSLFLSLLLVMGVVFLFVTPLIDIGWMNTLETLSALLALVLLIFVVESYKRADAEDLMKRDGVIAAIEETTGGLRNHKIINE